MACAFSCRTGAYLDQELPAAEREAYAAHLSACDECARELARLERLSRFLSAAGSLASGTERIVWQPRLNWPRLVRFTEMLGAAAALVAAVCGLWLLRTGPRSDSAALSGWDQMAVTQLAEPGQETEAEDTVAALLRGQP